MKALLKAALAILGVASAQTRYYDAYHAAQHGKRTPDERSAGAHDMRHHAGEG